MLEIHAKRALIRTFFVVLPAIFIAAFAVYYAYGLLTARGVNINPTLYHWVSVIVVWAAMWFTTRRVLDDLRKHAAIRNARKEK